MTPTRALVSDLPKPKIRLAKYYDITFLEGGGYISGRKWLWECEGAGIEGCCGDTPEKAYEQWAASYRDACAKGLRP